MQICKTVRDDGRIAQWQSRCPSSKKSAVQPSTTASGCGGELFTYIQLLLLKLVSCYRGPLNREQMDSRNNKNLLAIFFSLSRKLLAHSYQKLFVIYMKSALTYLSATGQFIVKIKKITHNIYMYFRTQLASKEFQPFLSRFFALIQMLPQSLVRTALQQEFIA